jgi:hypothetical protein
MENLFASMVNHYSGVASQDKIKATGEQAVTIAIAKKFGTNGVKLLDYPLHALHQSQWQ